jgi:hypothetical protein
VGTPRNNILLFRGPSSSKKIIILRGGSVVGIISHEDLKKFVENSMRQWHPQSEIHKKMILRLDIGKH